MIDDSKRARILIGQLFFRTRRVQGVLEIRKDLQSFSDTLQVLDSIWWVVRDRAEFRVSHQGGICPIEFSMVPLHFKQTSLRGFCSFL